MGQWYAAHLRLTNAGCDLQMQTFSTVNPSYGIIPVVAFMFMTLLLVAAAWHMLSANTCQDLLRFFIKEVEVGMMLHSEYVLHCRLINSSMILLTFLYFVLHAAGIVPWCGS